MNQPNLIYKTPRGIPAFRLAEVPDEDGFKISGETLAPQPPGVELLQPLRLDLKVLREEDGYAVFGGFDYAVRLACSRCNEPAPFTGKAAFAYFMLPASMTPKDNEIQLGDADMDILYFADDEIELLTLAEEQLILALPGKPLCQEGACKGLCPVCGQNLNQRDCGCPVEAADGRLGAAVDRISAELFKADKTGKTAGKPGK